MRRRARSFVLLRVLGAQECASPSLQTLGLLVSASVVDVDAARDRRLFEPRCVSPSLPMRLMYIEIC